MPELVWNAVDFMECLEVFPEVGEFEVEHVYIVPRKGLVLAVTVWRMESVVRLSIRESESSEPVIEFALFVRDAVHYIKDKRGEFLEFRDCIVAPSRFSYLEMGDMFDKAQFKKGLTIQLGIKPNIKIRHIR